MSAKVTRVQVFKGVCDCKDWPSYKLTECAKWFADKLESIPEEFRENASVDIGTEQERWSDGYSAAIEIHYYRPETPDEEKAREKAYKDHLRNIDLEKREQLDKLTAYFKKQKEVTCC